MNPISLDIHLRKGNFTLQIEQTISASGVTAIFGPSGSGKTTFLRVLAGLETAEGTICCGDTLWLDGRRSLPPHKRCVGFVFQDAMLFEQMNIHKNLMYGLKRTPSAQRTLDPAEIIDFFDLAPLLAQRPRQLSAGEKQRVALARSLLAAPRVLLLDEPMAALDNRRKGEMIPYLERVFARFAIPIVYVSHSVSEVARLAQQTMLLEAGRIVASGATHELFSRVDLVGRFNALVLNSIRVQVVENDAEYALLKCAFAGGVLQVGQHDGVSVGDRLHVQFSAESITLSLTSCQQTSALNTIPSWITSLTEHSRSQILVQLCVREGSLGKECGDQGKGRGKNTYMLALITKKSMVALNLQVGMQVFAQVKSVSLVL